MFIREIPKYLATTCPIYERGDAYGLLYRYLVNNTASKGDEPLMRFWGSAEIPRFDLCDFDTEEYKCIAYCFNSDGGIVGAFMSESSEPPHYRVFDGTKELFYTRRADALAYLESVEPKKTKGRRM